MEYKHALNEVSKYIAQAKELIESYLKENSTCDPILQEVIYLLNEALDNVIV